MAETSERPAVSRVLLTDDLPVFPWRTHGESRTRGVSLSGEEQPLFPRVPRVARSGVFREMFRRSNGHFSCVMDTPAYTVAAVDHVRSFPLFYEMESDGGLRIADRAAVLLPERPVLDTLSEREFLATGYVTGSDTLIPGIRQLQAGEYLLHDKRTRATAVERYFEYWPRESAVGDEAALCERLHEVHRQVFERMISTLGGRQAVVPLSGGHDSRLIVWMLKRCGYDNVVCYSYGPPGNWEAKVSRRVAELLGFRWIFVPYSRPDWRIWHHSAERIRYTWSAGNCCAVAHMQDWPAVMTLRRTRAVTDDAVIIPGHTGDFLSGGHVPRFQPDSRSPDGVRRSIYRKHYRHWPDAAGPVREALLEKIGRLSGCDDPDSPYTGESLYEHWEWQERQAKYICNSVRVYEFWGYEWRMPLWNRSLVDFWSAVPVPLKLARRLWLDYVRRYQSHAGFPPPNPRPGKIRHALSRVLRPGFARFTGNRSMPLALFSRVPPGMFAENVAPGSLIHLQDSMTLGVGRQLQEIRNRLAKKGTANSEVDEG